MPNVNEVVESPTSIKSSVLRGGLDLQNNNEFEESVSPVKLMPTHKNNVVSVKSLNSEFKQTISDIMS